MILAGLVLLYLLLIAAGGYAVLKRLPYPHNVIGLLVFSGTSLSLFFFLFPLAKAGLGL